MIYPDIDSKIWIKMYGLSTKSRPCPKCKEIFEATTPVAVKGYRGLQAPVHACGGKYAYTVFVPVEKSEVRFWINLKYEV